MPLQLEKRDELPNGKLTIKAYKNTLATSKGTSYGRVQSPSDRVTLSNLSALIADRNPGIQPAMVSFVGRLLHEETVRQLRDGKNVEVLGIGTAYVATKGSMKGLNPSLSDVPKMILKFRTSKEVKKQMLGMSAKLVVPIEVKPIINTVIDMKSKKVNEIKNGSIIQIKGKNLRVEGNSTNNIGISLINGSGSRVNITVDSIIRNEPSTLEVVLPPSISVGFYFVEVRTQTKLKDGFSNTLKVGVSDFKIEVK